MAKITVLFLLLAVIQASLALKCKVCADNDGSCSTLKDETCPAGGSDREAACLIHIYKDAASKKEMTEKKCVNRFKNTGKYDCIEIPNNKQVKCYTCVEDFCNEKNSATKFGVVGLVSLVLSILVSKLL
ncbi:hypothetical protein TcasGA2_TC006597 [Tribolium castaneum]|uniref:Protein sleepless n=1 Tax=Tribolium castaneum TaxID=7070 RepID=D6WXR6_TRICA|nr:PREDICTED: uncharacterized protein LOC662421 [Tribolium castaneum]EFA08896.1 hypothetical protein TcasGA2_TC006597 [Tribolium castaneum]|eukprot:XP_976424.1 PREDICTED: uncharacterized protein LOC662421 [Tribolium castaneum]